MKAKKEYGQNFLSDRALLESIADFAGVTPDERVFEIGPGRGALTEVLLGKGAYVTALEIDPELFVFLEKKFAGNEKLKLVQGDILNIPPESFFTEIPLRVVANIPYYITAPIIRTLVTRQELFKSMTLLVQKEVAWRLAGMAGNRSVITVMAQYYADVSLGPVIEKKYFDPVPRVDSALITLVPKRKYDQDFDKVFFRFVKIGFAARRKTLLNNLVAGQLTDKKTGEEFLASQGIATNARPQELSVEQWLDLFAGLQEKKSNSEAVEGSERHKDGG